MTEQTSKTTSTQRAAEELRQMIVSGTLAAGTDHLETELAARLGMSRTPVREATLVLEGQGLLEVRPRKGVRILPISPEDMEEIYAILTTLESLAAGRAAQIGYGRSDLAELSESIAAMDAALAQEDREGWAAADSRFHSELMRLGGNKRAEGIVHMLSDQVHRARMATLWVRPLPEKSNDDHRRVRDAIRAGNFEEARQAHHSHRVQSGALLVELLRRNRLFSL
ncbi:MAG: GntR family transcriptional regulator [Pseudomonadota bacterium]